MATILTPWSVALMSQRKRALIDFNFIANQTLPTEITFSRTTNGTRFNASGLLVTESQNVPRFDYDPATLSALGLLVEPQRTNTVTQSNELGTWIQNNVTVSPNVEIFQDGTQSMDSVTAAAAASPKSVRNNSITTTSGISYSLTVVVKKTPGFMQISTNTAWIDTAYVNVNTESGATSASGVAHQIRDVGSFWRFGLTADAVYTAGGGLILNLVDSLAHGRQLPAVATGPQYWGGVQFEQGAFYTSYIPTTTAAVTRTADIATVTLPQTADILVQDREGGQWITGVPAGPYTLAPRTNKRHIARWRAYPAGYAASHPELAVAYQ